MKSGKARRREIKERRRRKAEAEQEEFDVYCWEGPLPSGAVKADHEALGHNNTYGLLPRFYHDQAFTCVDCGSEEIWTTKQQKWWYEIIKANIDSRAIRCRACRKRLRDAKAVQKKHMDELRSTPPHPNEAFFRNRHDGE